MAKASKNLGITKSCPKCRKTLIKYSSVVGRGTFNIKCPHCDALVKVEIEQKTSIKVIELVAVLILVVAVGIVTYVTFSKSAVVTQIPYEDPK